MNENPSTVFLYFFMIKYTKKLTFWGGKMHSWILKTSTQQANPHLIDSACGSFEERGQVTYFESAVPSRTVAQIGNY